MFEDSELNVDGCSQSMMILVALAGFVVVLVLIGRFWSQRRGIGLLGDPVGAQAGRLNRLYSAGRSGPTES